MDRPPLSEKQGSGQGSTPKRDKMMELAKLLHPQAVKCVSDVTSKKRLLQTIADIASDLLSIPAGNICGALQERESLGPTGVGSGVALPHARLPGLTAVTGAFLKLDRAIDFDSVDRKPVDLVFALFAPEESGTEHLKALALVSRTLRNRELCEKLRANSESATLHTLLTEARTTQAA